MGLTIHRKSLYLILFNATMISRSVGKTLKANRRGHIKDFKIRVFEEVEDLTSSMDAGSLTEDDVLLSIRALSDEFGISVGQAQKAINVILKYHFYLTRGEHDSLKSVLHCPIDSVVQSRLGKYQLYLTEIDMEDYLGLQREIQNRCQCRIDFDTQWDKKNLGDEGIL